MDKKLKDKAMKKARREGYSLSDVFRAITWAYVNDELEIKISVKRH